MLELDDTSKIIKNFVIKEVCSWLPTFHLSSAGGIFYEQQVV